MKTNSGYKNDNYILYNGVIYKILKIINKTARVIIINIENLTRKIIKDDTKSLH